MTCVAPPNRAIIFDFDGTLADTFPLVLGVLTEYCAAKRRPVPSAQEIERIRNMDSRKIFDHLGIPRWQAPLAIAIVRRKLRRIEDRLMPFVGIPDALEALHASGWRLFVLSSNTAGTIRRFIIRHQLPQPERLEGGVRFFGKEHRLRRLLKMSNLPSAQTVLVGDETRDVHVGRAVGTPVVGVSWGFNTATLLREAGAAVVVDSPQDLTAAMERLLHAMPGANDAMPDPSRGPVS